MQESFSDNDYAKRRDAMVQQQLVSRGINDALVLKAMRTVPREQFVPVAERDLAYHDGALPIGAGQTISQPYIVALMAEALQLKGNERVLEIGTGSGYGAAVLGKIAEAVFSVERVAELAVSAARILAELGYDNVHVKQDDGTLGWAEHAPFDAIVVTAGGPDVPESLKKQLTVGGRLVIPVGRSLQHQTLVKVLRTSEDGFQTIDLGGVRFVPLVGEEGWHEGANGSRTDF